MLKQLIDYKFSELRNLDTSDLTELKSIIFKETYYIFKDKQLIFVADGTVANDSHDLARRLIRNEYANKSEIELYNTEMQN